MIALEATPNTRSATSPNRRDFLRGLAAAGAFGRFFFSVPTLAEANPDGRPQTALDNSGSASLSMNSDKSIRPYHVAFSDGALVDLRRRLNATNWPERETVMDASQGVQLATMLALARYWQGDYDWRKVEARLNSLPQFITNIDGLDIHFIHVRSKNLNALPAIITHGWPGSVIEQLKIVGPLTDPIAYGARIEDSFDVVIPSLPGHGFSGKPTSTGWDPQRVARAWVVLMDRLGYTRYVAQGGDWGNAVTDRTILPRRLRLVARRHLASQLTRSTHTINSTPSTSTALATLKK
jgi:hypothetical protein